MCEVCTESLVIVIITSSYQVIIITIVPLSSYFFPMSLSPPQFALYLHVIRKTQILSFISSLY